MPQFYKGPVLRARTIFQPRPTPEWLMALGSPEANLKGWWTFPRPFFQPHSPSHLSPKPLACPCCSSSQLCPHLGILTSSSHPQLSSQTEATLILWAFKFNATNPLQLTLSQRQCPLVFCVQFPQPPVWECSLFLSLPPSLFPLLAIF